MASFLVGLTILVVAVALTICHRPKETDHGSGENEKAKLREHLILDIRGANQYCLGYIALLGVMVVIAANNRSAFLPFLNKLELWPFKLAFLSAAFATLFIPAGYGARSFAWIRIIWFRTIICEQVLVACVCYGLWKALTILIQ